MANFFLLNRDNFHSSRDNVVGLVLVTFFLWTRIRLLSTERTARVCTSWKSRTTWIFKEEEREGAPTSRDPGDDQLSEYDDDSSDNDCDDFAVEEDDAICDMQNSELSFGAIAEHPSPAITCVGVFEEWGISQ